jgi:geranyl-CoA carboxylase alpha subunit
LRSLLIANRGEIVVRVARTARRLGIETVTVFSDADRDAPFVAACDRAVAIGGERPGDSYLRIDRLVQAAREARVDAVHPGYGFLSESAEFAEAVLAAGLTWVGPPPAAMRAMADKAAARQAMRAAGVPVLPGYDGEAQDAATLGREARRIGLPVMVKAAAGGGGRGMRWVADDAALDEAFASAAAEAAASFGDGRLVLERAVVGARHVEVQVVADGHGRTIHLAERDCSVQRRHQKLIEEAPAPGLPAALRRRMGEVAVAVAEAVAYRGAGTVEFLLDGDGAFWFIEMNTRLQVEHAVTEALVGIDLVEWQLRIADGDALPMTQDEALRRYESGGHAVEARLCAEDPGAGFLPQSGRIVRWSAPPHARCDHALADGTPVSPFYDSMLAKVVAHGRSRADALARLADALDATVCLGMPTNRGFLASVLREPAFAAGGVDTAYLGRVFADDASRGVPTSTRLEALAAAALALVPATPLPPLWAGWSSTPALHGESVIACAGSIRRWRLRGSRDDLSLGCDGASHRIRGLRQVDDGAVVAEIDGRSTRAVVARDGDRSWWLADGEELAVVDRRLQGAPREAASRPGLLLAPMHGRVTQSLVGVGAAVDAGALLLVIEAMKMEHAIRAPHAGTVSALHARAGDQVAARQPLVEVTA